MKNESYLLGPYKAHANAWFVVSIAWFVVNAFNEHYAFAAKSVIPLDNPKAVL